jgi:hypothetical protein
MRGRDAAALRVVALVLLVLSAGCGGAGGGGSSAGDGSSAGGGVSTGGPKLTPDVIRYMEYIKRCHQATRELAEANVIYDPDMEMTLKESKTVTALVTLNTKIPPDQLLPNRGAKADAIYVACEIEARLSGGVDEFTIQPAELAVPLASGNAECQMDVDRGATGGRDAFVSHGAQAHSQARESLEGWD